MTRSLALFLGFGLLCSVFACDNGSGETADTGSGDTGGPEVNPCGTEWAEKDGTTPSIMDDFGAPCMDASDCVPILGADAKCVTNILDVYDLPGGFCTLPCDLPDSGTTFESDSPQCDPSGGVTCVGAQGLFTACIRECTSDDQCGREGYGCRTMPTIGAENDPKFCLMQVYDCCSTDLSQCGP